MELRAGNDPLWNREWRKTGKTLAKSTSCVSGDYPGVDERLAHALERLQRTGAGLAKLADCQKSGKINWFVMGNTPGVNEGLVHALQRLQSTGAGLAKVWQNFDKIN